MDFDDKVHVAVIALMGTAAVLLWWLNIRDIVTATRRVYVVVRDLKAQSQETAVAVSKLVREAEGEANG
jgi:hypothetical protein